MPQYDFRCKTCHHQFSVTYKTYQIYDAAKPKCPECGTTELSRMISSVAIPQTSRDYRNMSSTEMLSVLESGEKRQVDEMFKQVGGAQDSKSGAGPIPRKDD